MRLTVTAVLVIKHGGNWLEQTLTGLAAQTRQPDEIIAVVCDNHDSVARQLQQAAHITRILPMHAASSFGAAVHQAVAHLPMSDTVSKQTQQTPRAEHAAQHWLWLLTEDSAPEPHALAEILGAVQRAPSVAIAGPKLLSWDRPDHIIELGQSLTRRGERWLPRRHERDQQQYDHLQDVLGVGSVGMLIRDDVWHQLSGFDPAYPVYDDGLDLSVRARLAGFRVVVAPTSRIRFAQLGVAGPRIERSRRLLRSAHREARTSQLHRRIAYAPAGAACAMWLGLPFLAVFRVCLAIIREHPDYILGEFFSALRVFFRPHALIASRSRIRLINHAGWRAVHPLRVDQKTVRTTRMIEHEAILAAQGKLHAELRFISSGGLAVLLCCVLATLGLTWWATALPSLTGGSLAPLSPIAVLWRDTQPVAGTSAHPFAWVLALLGTITFWNPSQSIVVLFTAAVPLAAFGGWIWAAQLTANAAARALLALGWAFSPVLLTSLISGRITTLIVAVILPWLLLASTRARTSWSWAATASLFAAMTLACAPSLIPAAVALLAVGIILSPRSAAHLLAITVAPLILFAPRVIELLRVGDPLLLVADPGIPALFRPANTWQLLLGFPEFGLAGWSSLFERIGINDMPTTALVGMMLLLLVLLAATGLLTGNIRLTLGHAALGGLGLLTASIATNIQLASVGAEPVSIWTGSGLTLYWLALLSLAAIGVAALRRIATPLTAVAVVTALIVVAPLAAKLATAHTSLTAGDANMPAIVQASGSIDPTLRTLVLTTVAGEGVRAEIVTGSGIRLNKQRIDPSVVTEQDQHVAELVGILASTGNDDQAATALARQDISFVLLDTSGIAVERSRLQSALDQQATLENAGQTQHGLLWRVLARDTEAQASAEHEHASTAPQAIAAPGQAELARMSWWLQVFVLGAIALLALPTAEITERPQPRRKTDTVSKTPVAHAPAGDR